MFSGNSKKRKWKKEKSPSDAAKQKPRGFLQNQTQKTKGKGIEAVIGGCIQRTILKLRKIVSPVVVEPDITPLNVGKLLTHMDYCKDASISSTYRFVDSIMMHLPPELFSQNSSHNNNIPHLVVEFCLDAESHQQLTTILKDAVTRSGYHTGINHFGLASGGEVGCPKGEASKLTQYSSSSAANKLGCRVKMGEKAAGNVLSFVPPRCAQVGCPQFQTPTCVRAAHKNYAQWAVRSTPLFRLDQLDHSDSLQTKWKHFDNVCRSMGIDAVADCPISRPDMGLRQWVRDCEQTMELAGLEKSTDRKNLSWLRRVHALTHVASATEDEESKSAKGDDGAETLKRKSRKRPKTHRRTECTWPEAHSEAECVHELAAHLILNAFGAKKEKAVGEEEDVSLYWENWFNCWEDPNPSMVKPRLFELNRILKDAQTLSRNLLV